MKIIFSLYLFLFLSFITPSLTQTKPKAKVYFTPEISKEKILEMYQKLGVNLEGKVALKVHSGEVGGKYFLKPSLLKPVHDFTKGTFVECNTAYNMTDGTPGRFFTEQHLQTAKTNGWLEEGIRFQIMDEKAENDYEIEINPHKVISRNIVGEHLKEYDSCLVLSHVKGHIMGGFGGALKQLSIGFASRNGKANIHSSGVVKDARDPSHFSGDQFNFTNSMADSASSIVKYFNSKNKGGIVFINVISNISTGCDCMGADAPEPKIKDFGILASTDPVAIDRASLDLINSRAEEKENGGKKTLFDQISRLYGTNTISAAEELGVGTTSYELIEIESFGRYLKCALYGLFLGIILF